MECSRCEIRLDLLPAAARGDAQQPSRLCGKFAGDRGDEMGYTRRRFARKPALTAASGSRRTARRRGVGVCCWLWPAAALRRARRTQTRRRPQPRAAGRSAGPISSPTSRPARVIEELDALRPWYPASTTKLMTHLRRLPRRAGGRDPARFARSSTAPARRGRAAEQDGLQARHALTLDDALKMMMVKSANDIAVAVAEAVGGSVAGFAAAHERRGASASA